MKLPHKTRKSFVLLYALAVPFLGCDAAKPSAVSVPIRSDFIGFDGSWSPVSIRVGSPPQWANVLVSTASQETWVIGPGGCDETQRCIDERGGTFTSGHSATWEYQGDYMLGLVSRLGFNDSTGGVYGFDKITLSDSVSVPEQLVAVVNSTEHWLGYFGLGVKPTNLTNTDTKTFLSSMVENQSLIPSHSYGFTAGASNRLKGVPGSLTLGGYDANRFVPHDTSFSLDPGQNPVIALNRITATAKPNALSNVSTGWKDDTVELLTGSEADYFTIDSTTPFLWLPETVCVAFEKALGLSYDDELELYTLAKNASLHDMLVNWNLSFNFIIADTPASTKTVSLALGYSAFDHQLTFPYPNAATTRLSPNGSGLDYFPLRKASNSSQYTLGRAFLQETYLKVDYERNNFSVHPATFSLDALTNIDLVDITRPKNSTWAGPNTNGSSTLSAGSIAGITIAAVFGLGFFICLLVVFRRMQRNHPDRGYIKEKDNKSIKTSKAPRGFFRWFFCIPPRDEVSEMGAFEAPHDRKVVEIGGKETGSGDGSELEGNDTGIRGYYERDAREQKNPNTVINAIGHDPAIPVELPYRSSNYRVSSGENLGPDLYPGSLNFSRPGMPAFKPNNQKPKGYNAHKSIAVSSPSDSRDSKADSDRMHIVSPISPTNEDVSPQFSSLDSIARRAAWFISNDSPSISSESPISTERSRPGAMSIDQRVGFGTSLSRQDTVSSMDPTYMSGTMSASMTVSPQESPASHTRAPRNSRATAVERAASPSASSGTRSGTSTVTNDIRQSVQRGFGILPGMNQQQQQQQHQQQIEGSYLAPPRTPVTAGTAGTEQSPYSPARWIEFWKTGRDPRLGPASDGNASVG